MCGIAALLVREHRPDFAGVIERMTDAVEHRGPDGAGIAFFHGAPVEPERPWRLALGHRRLAIIDVSAAGHQPMSYRNHFWITYNGEIYNYIELRAELERLGHRFRSSSDTEVILAAYAQWRTRCFERLRGMFALVLIDLERREAVIARDRLGIKPLYYWRGSGVVAVVSEIKQLLAVPGFRPKVDLAAAAEFMPTGYEAPTRSFFAQVEPLAPGTSRTISLDNLAFGPLGRYWRPERIEPVIKDPREASDALAHKLGEAVRIHLRSDVPVACALSGGLDSSSLAVLMRRAADSIDLHTFTITFPGAECDESRYARAALDGMQVVPHFVTPDAGRLLEDLNDYVAKHDEPIGTLQTYPGYCLARLTHEAGIKVTLNGQGGDEAMSGYWQTYFMHLLDLARAGRVFALLGHLGGALSGTGNPEIVRQIPVMLRRYRARRGGEALLKLRAGVVERPAVLAGLMGMGQRTRRLYEMLDLFLPRLLKWDDRNFMAFGLEGRYPFLDHELLELCLSFDPSVLYRRGWTKWPLRAGLENVLPDTVRLRRTKFGYEVPLVAWLRGPLRPVVEDWLSRENPVWDLVSREDVRRLTDRVWHDDGSEAAEALFRAFMFDRWMERFNVAAN